jgi:Flp pilus assembly pilin Flp
MRKLPREDRAAGAIEYALVAMLISVGGLSAYANLGAKIAIHWTGTYSSMSAHLR